MLNSGLFHLLWPLNYDMENRIGWAVTIEVMQGDLIFLRGHQQEAWQPLCLTVSWNRGPLCSHLLVSLQAGSCLSDRVVSAWCGVFLPALHFPHTHRNVGVRVSRTEWSDLSCSPKMCEIIPSCLQLTRKTLYINTVKSDLSVKCQFTTKALISLHVFI